MSQLSPYEQLGINEDASTEEILEARDRLLAEADSGEDRKQREQIEAAYDAVLMDRLRLRQEGKIKVPDRIRFPEKTTQQTPSFAPVPPPKPPNWLSRLFVLPTAQEFGLPTLIFGGLTLAAFFYPALQQLVLIAAVIAASYLIYRRERQMGKSILISLGGLLGGFLIGGLIWTVFSNQLAAYLSASLLDTGFVMFLLWFLSIFLR